MKKNSTYYGIIVQRCDKAPEYIKSKAPHCKSSTEINEYIGYSDFDLNYTINGELSCRLEENTLGDLITDALRHYGQSDVAFINGGSIRDNLLKGKIIYKNID